MLNKPRSAGINRLIKIQFLLIVVIAVVTKLTLNNEQAVSALLGGLVAYLPILLFTKKMFAVYGARAARQIVKNFYTGEFLKITSSALLFTVVFIMYPIKPLAFFLTYIAVVLSHWMAPVIIDSPQK